MMLELFITSTALIMGIFCLRKLTLGKISMRLRYALWLLVAVRLLVPASVGTSALSVMNLLPVSVRENVHILSVGGGIGWQQSTGDGQDLALAGETGKSAVGEGNPGAESADMEMAAENGGMPAALGETVSEKQTVAGVDAVQGKDGAETKAAASSGLDGVSLPGILGVLWLLGFLAVGGYMAVSKWRFLRYLYGNRKMFPVEELPGEFAGRLSDHRMKVFQVKGLPGPCLVGRHIYMGEGRAVPEQNLTHILAHEYCHALHGDRLWAFLRCALAAVYWFDPFVWAAAYAARQDSELACDEAAVELLGESDRFAYGRTLLALLESGGNKEKCPGMTFMTEGGERGVRERILALAGRGRTKRSVWVMVLMAAVLICGCAFTGAKREEMNPAEESEEQNTAGTNGSAQGENDAEVTFDAQNRQSLNEEDNEEFARIREEYEDVVKNAELTEEQMKELEESARREADRAAFEDMLSHYSAIEETDNREFDIQSYFDWKEGKDGEKPEDGWYLLCREEGGLIYLYGLYTEDFGFRGLKLRIGADETNLDIPWCPSYANRNSKNIRILELAENGWPRRFAWKQLVEESGTVEIWRLYSGYRYDTGTVDLKALTAETCVEWAEEYLTFDVDQEEAKVHVTCDGDMYLGAIDISAYQDWETEDVQVVPDAVSFTLHDDAGADTGGSEGEGLAVYLSAGLKIKGLEGLWFDGLPILTIQVAEAEDSESGFFLERPRIDEVYEAQAPWQEKELLGLQGGTASAQEGSGGQAGQDELEKPLVNGTGAHHDLEIAFSNPCPDFDRISDGYGERTYPVTGEVRTHTGVDMAAPEGADILAAADGMVFMTGFDSINGNYVALWHEQSGQMTYYAHCKTVEVEKGQQVERGERIATVGKTGTATGPCLHFAISSGTNWEEPFWEELGE